MKKLNQITLLIVVTFSISLFSCSKSSQGSLANSTGSNAANITNSITGGNWTVSSYIQRSEDKTAQFNNIVFVFSNSSANSGTVTATKNNTSVNGSWSYSPAVTYYGSTSTSSMVLNLGTSSPFNLLSKTWNVVSITSSKITLVNPEVIEDEHLVFSK